MSAVNVVARKLDTEFINRGSVKLLHVHPERRMERHMEEANKGDTDIPDGWETIFRPMTDAEQLKFDEEHRFMEEVVYAGLQNINTGFDAEGIFHFSPADFGKVIDRCEPLQIFPNGIEVFTTDGGFIECVFAMDDGSPAESFDWALRLVKGYIDTPDITMSATFNVPDSALASSEPKSDRGHSVDGDARNCSPNGKWPPND